MPSEVYFIRVVDLFFSVTVHVWVLLVFAWFVCPVLIWRLQAPVEQASS
jgi:hypothetical protein